SRDLVVSDYVRLEVLPKPIYHRRAEEEMFMRKVLESAENVSASVQLIERAISLASKYNLSTLDALHAAAAYIGQVDELVTLEKPTKPICQVREVRVVSLY